jgi:hypothetical protein
MLCIIPSTTLQDIIESSPHHPESGDLIVSNLLVNDAQQDPDELFCNVGIKSDMPEFDVYYGPSNEVFARTQVRIPLIKAQRPVSNDNETN